MEQWRVDDATTGGTIGYFYLDLYPRLQTTGVLLTELGSIKLACFFSQGWKIRSRLHDAATAWLLGL